MIVSTKVLFEHAYGNYAVGAYNINNAEQIMSLFQGNMDSKAPFSCFLAAMELLKVTGEKKYSEWAEIAGDYMRLFSYVYDNPLLLENHKYGWTDCDAAAEGIDHRGAWFAQDLMKYYVLSGNHDHLGGDDLQHCGRAGSGADRRRGGETLAAVRGRRVTDGKNAGLGAHVDASVGNRRRAVDFGVALAVGHQDFRGVDGLRTVGAELHDVDTTVDLGVVDLPVGEHG